MSDDLVTQARQALEGTTPGRAVQFHPEYCAEAKGTQIYDWDSSHHVSVIRADGSRYRIAEFRHASDAAFYQSARSLIADMADRIEALTKEREKDRANINLKADFIDETLNQLAEAGFKLANAEALAEELDAKVKNLTAHHPNMADPRYWEGRYRDEKAKLAKAVEAASPLLNMAVWTESAEDTDMVIVSAGTVRRIRTALAEIEGERT